MCFYYIHPSRQLDPLVIGPSCAGQLTLSPLNLAPPAVLANLAGANCIRYPFHRPRLLFWKVNPRGTDVWVSRYSFPMSG